MHSSISLKSCRITYTLMSRRHGVSKSTLWNLPDFELMHMKASLLKALAGSLDCLSKFWKVPKVKLSTTIVMDHLYCNKIDFLKY